MGHLRSRLWLITAAFTLPALVAAATSHAYQLSRVGVSSEEKVRLRLSIGAEARRAGLAAEGLVASTDQVRRGIVQTRDASLFGATWPRPLRLYDPAPAYLKVLGRSPTVRAHGAGLCQASWSTSGVRAIFAGNHGSACVSERHRAIQIQVTSALWETDTGLRIGHPVSVLRQLYAGAKSGRTCWRSRGAKTNWWGIAMKRYGDYPFSVCAVAAVVVRGRVTAFVLSPYVPA